MANVNLTAEQLAALNAVFVAAGVAQIANAQPAAAITEPVKRYNEALNGIELLFPDKPDEVIRESLKAAGFHWNRKTKVWYVKQSAAAEETANAILAYAKRGGPAPAKAAQPAAQPKPQAPAKPKPGVVALGSHFALNAGFPGELELYTVAKMTDKQVTLKDENGNASRHSLKRTEKGNYYVIIEGRRAPLYTPKA